MKNWFLDWILVGNFIELRNWNRVTCTIISNIFFRKGKKVLPVFLIVQHYWLVQLSFWLWCNGCSETPSQAPDADDRCTRPGTCPLSWYGLKEINLIGNKLSKDWKCLRWFESKLFLLSYSYLFWRHLCQLIFCNII